MLRSTSLRVLRPEDIVATLIAEANRIADEMGVDAPVGTPTVLTP